MNQWNSIEYTLSIRKTKDVVAGNELCMISGRKKFLLTSNCYFGKLTVNRLAINIYEHITRIDKWMATK